MPANFTTPDAYDASKGYKRVRFGEDGGVTETELIELQKIQHGMLTASLATLAGGTGTTLFSGTMTYNGTTFSASALVGMLEGELFRFTGTLAANNGETLYLNVQETDVTYQQDPALLDARMGEETTRRTKNVFALTKTGTGTGKFYELGRISGGVLVETMPRLTPLADLGTDDINVIAPKPSATLLSAYPHGMTVYRYATGDAGYPATNATILTFNNAQGTDGFQVLYGYVSSKPVQYVRYYTGSAWGAWEKFATSADLAVHTGDTTIHITDAERTAWNAKASTAVATTSSNGLLSSTDKTKLDGVATGANNYSHPSGDGNLHVPATGTTNNLKVLTAGSTAGSLSWANVSWNDVLNKPTTFTPSAHAHIIGDVTGLQAALDAKAAASHTHAIGDVTGLQTALDGKAPTSHTHTIANVTNLQTTLDGKAPTSHTHAVSDVTGLQTALDGKASTAAVTTGANGLMIATDKVKLDGISAGANRITNPGTNGAIAIDGVTVTVYTHPANHPASIITQDASNRFVTDTEKATWNGMIPSSQKGVANGVAPLGADGKISNSYLNVSGNAASITVTDSGSYYAGTNVESVLQEIGNAMNGVNGSLIDSVNKLLG